MPLIKYWDKFRCSFIEEIQAFSNDALLKAWESSTNRTSLYEKDLLEPLSNKMGLKYIKEEFKVDYSFGKTNEYGYTVPIIFIESENIALDAIHEIRKLCCLSAPLKVLITCVEWCDEPGYWPNGGYKKTLTDRWSERIKSHNSIWPQPSVYGVLVAERKENLLRYYGLAFGADGSLIEDNGVIFERVLS